MKTLITIFWIMDILNFPWMDVFDTKYPLNGLFWFVFWILASNIDCDN